jgi:predicted aspartyl protease
MAKNSFKDTLANKTKSALGSSVISLEAIKQQIEVLPELKTFIPTPISEEVAQLEKNLLQYGCRDALSVWEATDKLLSSDGENETDSPRYILVDGHNRLEICRRHSLSFTIQLLNFDSLTAVKDYMIDLQLGRRNLTPQQTSYFRGLRYQNEKSQKGKYSRDDHKVHSEPYGSTAENLAREYNVSKSTIKRDAQLATGLSRLDKPLRDTILSGEVTVDKKTIQELANLPEETPAIKSMEEIPAVKSVEEVVAKKDRHTVPHTMKELESAVKVFIKTKDKSLLPNIKKQLNLLEKLL